jgi:hypothetical protein
VKYTTLITFLKKFIFPQGKIVQTQLKAGWNIVAKTGLEVIKAELKRSWSAVEAELERS